MSRSATSGLAFRQGLTNLMPELMEHLDHAGELRRISLKNQYAHWVLAPLL